jgi:hypothetical protein
MPKVHTKGHRREDNLGGPREQNGKIAQLGDEAGRSNNAEEEVRGMMLDQPEGRFPFVIQDQSNPESRILLGPHMK